MIAFPLFSWEDKTICLPVKMICLLFPLLYCAVTSLCFPFLAFTSAAFCFIMRFLIRFNSKLNTSFQIWLQPKQFETCQLLTLPVLQARAASAAVCLQQCPCAHRTGFVAEVFSKYLTTGASPTLAWLHWPWVGRANGSVAVTWLACSGRAS